MPRGSRSPKRNGIFYPSGKATVPKGDDEGEYTEGFRRSLKRSLSDMEHGRYYSLQEVKDSLSRMRPSRKKKQAVPVPHF